MAFLASSGTNEYLTMSPYIGNKAGFQEWRYVTPDSLSTVIAASYITDTSIIRKFRVGDTIRVYQCTDRNDITTQTDTYRVKVTAKTTSTITLAADGIGPGELDSALYAANADMIAASPSEELLVNPARFQYGMENYAFASNSDATATDRTIPARFNDVINVKDHGVMGDNSTDDTTAINALIAAGIASLNKRKLFFPRGFYKISSALTPLTGNDWEIYGVGKTASVILGSHDGVIFTIDVSATTYFRGQVHDLWIECTHVTGANSKGILVDASTSSRTGLYAWTFNNLRLRGFGLCGIDVEDTEKVDDQGNDTAISGRLSNAVHGYNNFIEIEIPVQTRYPTYGIRFQGGTGAGNIIANCQLRADAADAGSAGILIGSGGTDISVGDFLIFGCNCHLGDYGIDINGPGNYVEGTTEPYNRNVSITSCQFDAVDVAPIRLQNLAQWHVWPNAMLNGVGESLTNVSYTRSTMEGRNTLYMRALRVGNWDNNIVAINAGDASSFPTIESAGTDTNIHLSLRGKGTGQILLGEQFSNYISIVGNNVTPSGTVVAQAQGSATDITYRIIPKGAGDVDLDGPVTLGDAGDTHTINGTANFVAAPSGLVVGSTYTPTLTNGVNVAASTAYECQYIRIGAVVTVSGKVDIDPTAGTTATVLNISFPIASNIGAEEDVGGTAVCETLSLAGGIYGSIASDFAILQFVTTADVANRSWRFQFTYQII